MDKSAHLRAELPNLTDCGLPGIARIPYGLHACHFYPDRQRLVEALVPYFLAGLRNNERCLWVAAPPLPALEARQALEAAWDGVGAAFDAGAIRILDFDEWYASAAGLNGLDVVQSWLDEEQKALAAGYNGLRLTGNTSFLQPGDWATFMEYERAVSEHFSGRRIVALCSYTLQGRSAREVGEVMHAHECVFDRPDATWQVVARPV
jgi:two-component system, sensor histidine kinase PdtaS